MIHVKRLELRNWYRFAGEHTLELGPCVYGVVAEHEEDSERSNWLGKSALLTAIAFVLTGSWRLWPEDRSLADDWITRDTDEGAVAIKLSDGLAVQRSRKRGQSTQLQVIEPGREVATGDAAQAIVDAHLCGIDLGSWFFQQGSIASYVNQQPGDRMKAISEWAQLGKLVAAEKWERERLSAAEQTRRDADTALQVARSTIRALAERWFELEAGDGLSGVEEALGGLRGDAVAAVAQAEDRARLADAGAEQWARFQASTGNRERLAQVQQELAGLPTPLNAVLLRQESDECAKVARDRYADLQRAKDSCSKLAVLAKGQFDGKCPVDGHQCPDAASMNAARAANRGRHAEALEAEQKARSVYEIARESGDKAAAGLRAEEATNQRRTNLAAEAKRLFDSIKAAPVDRPAGDPTNDQREAHRMLAEARTTLQQVEGDLARLKELRAKEQRASIDLEAATKRCTTLRQAVQVMGRNGAQRAVAEGVLLQVDGLANDALASVGAELQVRQTWGHMTKDPEEQCGRCGEAYQGKRPKQCPACGAERGRKWVEQPEVHLTRVSGAARDMAGVAIRLAAGAWLRAARGSQWGCAVVDEAFGALDARHRKSLAAAMVSLLGGKYGFAQAFVVAHDRGVVDVLPGRIVVRGIGDRSTVEVVR